MRSCIGIVAASVMALAFAGCTQSPAPGSSVGQPPGVSIPVGPIPGPGNNLASLPQNPYQGDQVAMVEGRRLFVWYNCYGCHGGHGGGGMGPSLRDPVWKYGGDPAHVFASIAEGRGQGMPAWGTKIPSDQIWKLVTYIKSMRTPQEPDPPLVSPEPQVTHPYITAQQTKPVSHGAYGGATKESNQEQP